MLVGLRYFHHCVTMTQGQGIVLDVVYPRDVERSHGHEQVAVGLETRRKVERIVYYLRHVEVDEH